MARYYESRNIFDFPWDQVALGFWRKYPNPETSHVLTEDTLSRTVQGGKLITKRLLTKTNRIPKWGERFFERFSGGPVVLIVEESVVDRDQKTLVTYTRNIGYNKVMSFVEKVVYTPLPEDPTRTLAQRSAWVGSSLPGFGVAIRAFGIEKYKRNSLKMINGLNYILRTIFPSKENNTELQSGNNESNKADEKPEYTANRLFRAYESVFIKF